MLGTAAGGWGRTPQTKRFTVMAHRTEMAEVEGPKEGVELSMLAFHTATEKSESESEEEALDRTPLRQSSDPFLQTAEEAWRI